MKTSRRELVGLALALLALTATSQWWTGRRERDLGAQVAALTRPGDIRMLASETCSVCAAARAWFAANRIPYAECTIERDAACRAEFDATRSPGTPVIVVRGRPALGFDPEQLRAWLAVSS